MAQIKVSQLPAATSVSDTDNFLASQGATSRRVTGAVLRELFGLQGNWDATGPTGPATPEFFAETSATLISGTNYNVAPLAGVSSIKFAYGKPSPVAPSVQRWARFERVAYSGTDTIEVYGLLFTNGEATAADLLATFASFPTFVGSVQWLCYQIIDHATGYPFGIVADATGIVGGFPIPGPQTVGTQVFAGIDYDTGEFLRDISGTIDTLTPPFAITTCRQWFFVSDNTNAGTLAAGAFPMSFSATDGGRIGFTAVGDAIPPSDALDGKRYLVENSGTFNGKTLGAGDVAEFYANETSVIVTPASIPTLTEIAIALGPDIDAVVTALLAPLEIEAALNKGVIVRVANDSASPADGDCFIVGDFPFGNFAGFDPGTVAVYVGAQWYNVEKRR